MNINSKPKLLLIIVAAILVTSAVVFFVFKFLHKNKSSSQTPIPSQHFVFLNKKQKSIDVLDVQGNKIKTIYKQEGFNSLAGAQFCPSKNIIAVIERSFVGSVITTNMVIVDLTTNTNKIIDTKSYDVSDKSDKPEINLVDSFSPNCDYLVYSVVNSDNCSSSVYSVLQNKTIISPGCHNLFWSPTNDFLVNITREVAGHLPKKFGFINHNNLLDQFQDTSKPLEISSYDLKDVIAAWPQGIDVLPGVFFVTASKIVLFPTGLFIDQIRQTKPIIFDLNSSVASPYTYPYRPNTNLQTLNYVKNNRVLVDTSGFTSNNIEDHFFEYVDDWYRQSDSVEINVHSKDYSFAGWPE